MRRRVSAVSTDWTPSRAPIFPLTTYLSDENYVYAKVPMSTWTRWVQVILLGVAALLVAMISFGPDLAGMGAVALAIVFGSVGLTLFLTLETPWAGLPMVVLGLFFGYRAVRRALRPSDEPGTTAPNE